MPAAARKTQPKKPISREVSIPEPEGLTREEKAGVKRALDDLKHGRCMTHEEVMRLFDLRAGMSRANS
jgi:predicted transcriptional regulator